MIEDYNDNMGTVIGVTVTFGYICLFLLVILFLVVGMKVGIMLFGEFWAWSGYVVANLIALYLHIIKDIENYYV